MPSRPPETTKPSGNLADGGTKATALTNEDTCEEMVASNSGGDGFSKRHRRTVASRDAEMASEGLGNVTARTSSSWPGSDAESLNG